MNPVTSSNLEMLENYSSNTIPVSSDKASELLDQNPPQEISTSSKLDIEQTKDAQRFHKAITDAKNSGKEEDIRKGIFGTKTSKWYGAAVHTYSAEEYSAMRLFLSSNQLCGFALNAVDVVSVFKHINCSKGALDIIMPKAIEEGGRRLDCFSIKTALPTMYASHGFIPVAKVKFDPKHAPEEWNYQRDGEPDIIFMVYDRTVKKTLAQDFLQLKKHIEKLINDLNYSSYEEAVEKQKKFINNQK